jgi:hypothetical protein
MCAREEIPDLELASRKEKLRTGTISITFDRIGETPLLVDTYRPL